MHGGGENNKEKLTPINILVHGSALDALGRLFRGLHLQTLADIAEAAVVHGALEGVTLPPKAIGNVSVNFPLGRERKMGEMDVSYT
jgi:hypothetical protein